MTALCRDCFALAAETVARCPACRSPRVVSHPALERLSLAHLDCDAFYAAIEKRDRPELRDVPVIVGGGERGVVTTACYLARVHGARSAMPMAQARKLCPQATIVRPDMAKYAREGLAIRAMMRELTPAVEPLSIDEAFLDLAGTQALHREAPAVVMARLAARIEREVGITVSVGLASNKFLAKVASDMDKPRGFAVIEEGEAAALLAPRSVSVIWGVGQAMRSRLAADGITTVGQLQGIDETDLIRAYGSMGLRLARLSHGRDARPVKAERERKSVSAETTFDTDISQIGELLPILRRLSERVSRSLKEKGVAGRIVVLKLKTGDFRLRTRNRALADPTQLADRIYDEARSLLERETDGTRFRLLGVGVSDLRSSRRSRSRRLGRPRPFATGRDGAGHGPGSRPVRRRVVECRPALRRPGETTRAARHHRAGRSAPAPRRRR